MDFTRSCVRRIYNIPLVESLEISSLLNLRKFIKLTKYWLQLPCFTLPICSSHLEDDYFQFTIENKFPLQNVN